MKIGVAFSGGGVRGSAHVGVLRALRENNIPIDMVSGASAGSMAASLYAAGYTPDEMEKIALKMNQRLLGYNIPTLIKNAAAALFRKSVRWEGLISGDRLNRFMEDALQGRMISQSVLPVAIPAVDIEYGRTIMFISNRDHMHDTAQVRYIDQVKLSDAVTASSSLPVVFVPQSIAGYKLVDGGLTENIPVSILRKMGADFVIGVDLGKTEGTKQKVDSILEVGKRALDIQGRKLNNVEAAGADFLIQPVLADIGILDFEYIPVCIHRGYKTTLDSMHSLRMALNRHGFAA